MNTIEQFYIIMRECGWSETQIEQKLAEIENKFGRPPSDWWALSSTNILPVTNEIKEKIHTAVKRYKNMKEFAKAANVSHRNIYEFFNKKRKGINANDYFKLITFLEKEGLL